MKRLAFLITCVDEDQEWSFQRINNEKVYYRKTCFILFKRLTLMIAEKLKTYEPGTVDKIKLVVILKSQKPEPKF